MMTNSARRTKVNLEQPSWPSMGGLLVTARARANSKIDKNSTIDCVIFLNECCFLLFIIINKSKQQITNHKSINPESSSLTASLNTPKSEAAVVAPWSSVPGILTGMRLGILSVLRASATHAAGGARVGGTVAGT